VTAAPLSAVPGPGTIARLAELVARGEVAVLTGAGISTESGIPDYRGPGTAQRRHTPMTYQEFVGSREARQRYWARSHVGWRVVAGARPNAGHRAVAELERRGLLNGIITQNVDGLHQAGGAREIVELHGNLDNVVCLQCHDAIGREEHDARLSAANPHWHATGDTVNPDGDVDLSQALVDGFMIVDCDRCGGVLKPDVVFFGECVPRWRVDASYEIVAASKLLLVLGSSLTVMSGRRFVLRAAQSGIAVAIVNHGQTRGDEYASIRIDAPLGATLRGLTVAATGQQESRLHTTLPSPSRW
jgi:NAD-dependent SIR2 family protein deacetylase